MIKGLAITPPILGRISIGRMVEKNGKRLPEKDDQFTITTLVQTRDGWINHPFGEALRQKSENGKIRAIPARMIFNDPDLNLRAEYSLFDRSTGRPQCVGNGEHCKRMTAEGVETLPCPSPDRCPYSNGACKPYGRLNVDIGEDDELGTFIFRTTGYNSIRTLTARLSYYQAVSGNLLACMPLELRLRAKTTIPSYRSTIFFVDLTIREGMTLEQAITEAKKIDQRRKDNGFDQIALDTAAREGFGNAAFEFTNEEIPELLEEFFPESETDSPVDDLSGNQPKKSTLKDKLATKTIPPMNGGNG